MTNDATGGRIPAGRDGAGAFRGDVAGSLIRKIDLCRGLFAFLVVAAHSYDVCGVIHPEAIKALPAAVRLVLYATVQCGYYWVMGFFVLSGYCIQLSVGRQVESGRFSPGVYLAARLSRIMPLYYTGLVFAMAVEALVAPIRVPYYPDGLNPVGWLSQLVFAQRFFQTFGSFAPSWTITYELFYYLFFGLLAAVSARFRCRPSWYGMAICVTLGGAMQWRYLHGGKDALTLQSGLLFGLGTIWFMGALIAVHGPSLVRHRWARVVAMSWPLLFVSAVVLRGDGRCPEQGIYLLLGVAFTLMILRFQSVDATRAGTTVPAPRWIAATARVVGQASYPTYLFHGPVLILISSAVARWGLIVDWRASWLVMVASGIGFGLFLGSNVERPIMHWRAGYLARLKESSVARGEGLSATLLEIQR